MSWFDACCVLGVVWCLVLRVVCWLLLMVCGRVAAAGRCCWLRVLCATSCLLVAVVWWAGCVRVCV